MRTIRLSRLRGLPVLDSIHAMQAGAVSGVVVDTLAGRVTAIDVGHGDGMLVSRIPLGQVDRLDSHLVLVADAMLIEFIEPEEWNPRCVSSQSLLGMEILNEDGDRIGYIGDVHVDPRTLGIRYYEMAAPLWRSVFLPVRLWPSEIVACSSDVMIVNRPSIEAAERQPLPLRLPAGRGLRKVA